MVGEEDYPTDGVTGGRALPGRFLWCLDCHSHNRTLETHNAELYLACALSQGIEKDPHSSVFIQRRMSAYGGDLGRP